MIHWTSAAKKAACPGRREGRLLGRAKAVDIDRGRALIVKAFAPVRATWEAGEEAADAECRPLMEAARARLANNDWSPSSPEIESAVAAFVDTDDLSGEVYRTLVPLWIATHGLSFALRALLSRASLRRFSHARRGKDAGWYLVRKDPAEGPKEKALKGWGALRAELARATPENYEGARAVALEARAAAGLPLRCALSYAFPTEREWAGADATECFALAEFPGFGATLLVSSPLALSEKVAANAAGWSIKDEHIFTLVDEHGLEAVAPLAKLLDREYFTHDGSVVRALALLESPEAAALLAVSLAKPALRKYAQKYFSQHPALAVRTFARTEDGVVGRGVIASTYAAVAVEHPEIVEATKASLSAQEREVLKRLGVAAQMEAAARSSPEHEEVRAAWHKVEAVLSKRHPNKTNMLAPGATTDEVAKLEAGIGFSLPVELRASLLQHNGESDEAVGLFAYFELLAADRILDEWTAMKGIVAGWETNVPLDEVPGVKNHHWHTGWLPIAADGGGNFYCIDTDPAAGGQRGQVIFFDHEVGPQSVEAGSISQWLVDFADGLQRKERHIWEDGSVHSEAEG